MVGGVTGGGVVVAPMINRTLAALSQPWSTLYPLPVARFSFAFSLPVAPSSIATTLMTTHRCPAASVMLFVSTVPLESFST